jgi:hypothetical protein
LGAEDFARRERGVWLSQFLDPHSELALYVLPFTL